MTEKTTPTEKWFHLDTYLDGSNRKGEREPFCAFVLRATDDGTRVRLERGIQSFPTEEALVDAIESRASTELPREADGDPRYVPAEYEGRRVSFDRPSWYPRERHGRAWR